MLQSATWCYHGGVPDQEEINQRDLRQRSKEIMDAVQQGRSFTVTRDGHGVAELVPLRQTRRWVPRARFAAGSRPTPPPDLARFRADQEAAYDQELDDPHAR